MCVSPFTGKTGCREGGHYGPLVWRSHYHTGSQSRPEIPVSHYIPSSKNLKISLSLSHTHTLSLSLTYTHTLSLTPFLSHTHTLSLSLQVWHSFGLLYDPHTQGTAGDWTPPATALHQQLRLPVARQREEDDETHSTSARRQRLIV